jgi:hypothetical protein
MTMCTVRPLSQPRFEALLYRRSPWVEFIFDAKEWWSNTDESLIAVLGLDLIDRDYSWVALGRDETGVFRGVDVNTSLADLDTARANLHQRLFELSAGQA